MENSKNFMNAFIGMWELFARLAARLRNGDNIFLLYDKLFDLEFEFCTRQKIKQL